MNSSNEPEDQSPDAHDDRNDTADVQTEAEATTTNSESLFSGRLAPVGVATGVSVDDANPVVRRSHKRSATRNLLEWLGVMVVAVVVALLIQTFLVQAFRIPSESMEPTLQDGDRVLVNKLSYRGGVPNRGDVIVFHRPATFPAQAGEPEDLIKRVIGLPGDTLVTLNGQLYVNNRELIEPYLHEGATTSMIETPIVIPDGEVFLLGDNRNNSTDSRMFGSVPVDSIVGRAFLIMWPLSRTTGL